MYLLGLVHIILSTGAEVGHTIFWRTGYCHDVGSYPRLSIPAEHSLED